MTARSAFAKSFSIVAALALLAAAPACSSAEAPDAESSENAIIEGTVKSGTTTAFAGKFGIAVDGHNIKVEFKVTNIDWRALTARWDAKIVDRDGHPTVVDDVNVPMSIALARCPGCYTFNANDGAELARVSFSNTKLAGLAYSGFEATGATITSASAGEAGASCALICEGNLLECSEGGTEATCASSRFAALPRCPYQVTFEAKSCAARSDAPAPTTGSCSIVCGGNASDCKAGVTEAECNASIFASVPRCPHTFEFAAGASCGR